MVFFLTGLNFFKVYKKSVTMTFFNIFLLIMFHHTLGNKVNDIDRFKYVMV
jgi:hypothetical protein